MSTSYAPHPVEAKQVRALLDRHLHSLAYVYTYHHFDVIRAKYWARKEEADLSSEYQAEVTAMAAAIRVEAFDCMIADLAHMLKTDDLNMLMATIRRAGIRPRDGNIFVTEGPLSVTPTVFHPDAFVLNL